MMIQILLRQLNTNEYSIRNPSADIKEFFSSFSAMTKDFRNRKDKDDEQIKDESIGPIREYERPENGITL